MEQFHTQTMVVVEEEQKEIIKFDVKPARPQGGIRWAQDTVDNEHLNKKKSKSKRINVDKCKYAANSLRDTRTLAKRAVMSVIVTRMNVMNTTDPLKL